MNDDLKKIHDASMRILEKSGMIFHHPGILKLLEQKGIKVSGETAFFTREQVMEWVSKAPRRFRLFARNPKYDFVLGDNHIEFAPGYGAKIVCFFFGCRKRDKGITMPRIRSHYLIFVYL